MERGKKKREVGGLGGGKKEFEKKGEAEKVNGDGDSGSHGSSDSGGSGHDFLA